MVRLLRPLRRVFIVNSRPVLKFHTSSLWAARKVVHQFNLADIGEGITECEVIKWSVKPLGTVGAFDPLCEVQSDKASVEITSPFDGVVKQLLVQEGEVAKVGSGLCLIEVEEEDSKEVASEPVKEKETPKQQPQTEVEDAVRSEPVQEPATRRPHPLDPKNDTISFSGGEGAEVLATPSVRHFARQKGVNLTALAPGSGRGGRIEKKDVENFLTSASSVQSPAPVAAPLSTADEVVELGRTRLNMWKAMEKSLQVPHFGYSTYIDLTELDQILPTLNNHIPEHYVLDVPPKNANLPVSPSAIYPAPPPPNVPQSGKYARLTYLPFMLKTLSKAMVEWPLFRSSITQISRTSMSEPLAGTTSSKPTLTVRPHADISIALSTPTGLYAPTLQRVDTNSVYTIASQLRHLSNLGRSTPCGLTPNELPKKGGTITVSNVGAVGKGEFASPILVPGGGVAIVAIGRARWIRDEERDGERRLRVGISWSADHRVVEGAELAAFMECWRAWIENPTRMIAGGI